jgi:hypothetical protein
VFKSLIRIMLSSTILRITIFSSSIKSRPKWRATPFRTPIYSFPASINTIAQSRNASLSFRLRSLSSLAAEEPPFNEPFIPFKIGTAGALFDRSLGGFICSGTLEDRRLPNGDGTFIRARIASLNRTARVLPGEEPGLPAPFIGDPAGLPACLIARLRG